MPVDQDISQWGCRGKSELATSKLNRLQATLLRGACGCTTPGLEASHVTWQRQQELLHRLRLPAFLATVCIFNRTFATAVLVIGRPPCRRAGGRRLREGRPHQPLSQFKAVDEPSIPDHKRHSRLHRRSQCRRHKPRAVPKRRGNPSPLVRHRDDRQYPEVPPSATAAGNKCNKPYPSPFDPTCGYPGEGPRPDNTDRSPLLAQPANKKPRNRTQLCFCKTYLNGRVCYNGGSGTLVNYSTAMRHQQLEMNHQQLESKMWDGHPGQAPSGPVASDPDDSVFASHEDRDPEDIDTLGPPMSPTDQVTPSESDQVTPSESDADLATPVADLSPASTSESDEMEGHPLFSCYQLFGHESGVSLTLLTCHILSLLSLILKLKLFFLYSTGCAGEHQSSASDVEQSASRIDYYDG